MQYIKKTPVTVLLIVCNVLVFLLVDFTGGGTADLQHMLESGASYVPLIQHGEYWRLFTSMFLHFGIEHLINNMLVLYVLGERLERLTGHFSMAAIYLLGGLGGTLLSAVAAGNRAQYPVSAGASGCVFALMGGIIYVLIRNRGRAADLSLRRAAIMAVFSLYLGFASTGVDNAAHVGGLLSGFLASIIFYHPKRI